MRPRPDSQGLSPGSEALVLTGLSLLPGIAIALPLLTTQATPQAPGFRPPATAPPRPPSQRQDL